MIDKYFIRDLPEEEQLIFCAACEHILNSMQITGQFRHYQMMRPGVLADWLFKIANLKEEYHSHRQSLADKLRNYHY